MSPRASQSSIELPPFLVLESTAVAGAASIEDEVLSLFDAFRDPLLRYVCTFGLSIGDAEDVVQDVFLALFSHLSRRGDRTNLRGWLFTVAHNLALKHRAGRRHEHDRVPAEEIAHLVPDPGRDPEEQLTTREQRRQVMAALSALPETDRRCMQLRSSGLRYREIARVLGISLGGVAKSLTRSLARLQRVIGR